MKSASGSSLLSQRTLTKLPFNRQKPPSEPYSGWPSTSTIWGFKGQERGDNKHTCWERETQVNDNNDVIWTLRKKENRVRKDVSCNQYLYNFQEKNNANGNTFVIQIKIFYFLVTSTKTSAYGFQRFPSTLQLFQHLQLPSFIFSAFSLLVCRNSFF